MYSSILLIWSFFDIDSGLKTLLEGVQRTNRTTYYGETPFDVYKDEAEIWNMSPDLHRT